MPEVLRTVGRFELLQEVGRGGMAVVWLARQTDLDRKVALKELAPFHAADPAFAARFLRESRIAGGLNHPNIVTVHDYLEVEGVPFISMEYMEHGSLRPLVGKLTIAQVGYVLEGMLAGLAYAEQQGIVHRDLKPENVMVRADGQVKIADFGIAKAFNQASSTGFHTVTGTTVGTPAYMAPEQAMAKELGPWTDLYSTGVVAYELLVGQVPFSDTETPVAILLRHVNDPPPPPRSIKPDLDEGIEAWLLKMLSKNPADRYQHATDAWDALEEIIVTVAGPRWRRDARVLGLGGGSYTPTPMPSLPKIPTPPPISAGPPPAPPVEPPAGRRCATPAPQPEPVAAASPPPIDAFAASEPLATSAPLLAPQADSFEWPTLEPEVASPKEKQPKAPRPPKPSQPPRTGGSRRPLAIVLGLLLLAGGAVAAYLALGGGNGSGLSTVSTPTTVGSTPTSSTPSTTKTTTTGKPAKPLLADPPVPAAKRPALAVSGGTLFAAGPKGRIARLDGRSLRQLAVGSDATSPRALAVLGRTLIVADDRALYRLKAGTLAPIGASAFGPAPVLGGGGKAPLVAATGRRLCLVGVNGPGPCVRAAFAPTGVGATPGGTILAVDGANGTLVTFRRAGAKLAPKGAAIPVGKRAHGPVVVVGTRLRPGLAWSRDRRPRVAQGALDAAAAGHARRSRARRGHDRHAAPGAERRGARLDEGGREGSGLRRHGPARLDRDGGHRVARLRCQRRRHDHPRRREEGQGAPARARLGAAWRGRGEGRAAARHRAQGRDEGGADAAPRLGCPRRDGRRRTERGDRERRRRDRALAGRHRVCDRSHSRRGPDRDGASEHEPRDRAAGGGEGSVHRARGGACQRRA